MQDNLTNSFSKMSNTAKRYIEARIDLWKVTFLEKVSRIGIYFFTAISILVAFLFILLFLSLAFSFWYGNNYGDVSEGFLISAVFFMIISFLLFILRKPLFSGNIIKNVAQIVFSEDEDEKK